MGLSNDLISQFVKITKDKTDVKTETTVYGTTVEYNDKMYVKLDGSDLLTPIETTTDMKAGERVTVMIKDHTATVTGNLSSPAARTETVQQVASKVVEVEEVVANKATIKDLEAETARINTLVSDNVNIKNTLTATNAKIVNLEAEDATISGKLTAAEADIDKLNVDVVNIRDASAENLEATNAKIYNLESTYATFDTAVTKEFEAVHGTIDNLDSKYATIQNLNAAKGRIDDLEATRLTATSATIKNLQADVADIDTLIFGSASGDVIQSSFSNAVVAQLGNAMIKSAMIESVAADKVTAGNIYTNNVHVLSEDGRLIISDETIQISDENRVRVQIGKDASNDYSINIWDENGKLMFSEGGITDNAIKEAIIRNDMVSEDANISAKKLDIGSLFTTMNEDGSHTLHSSKVFVDADNQTLNVSFANMTTKVTTAEANASTAQSTAANANNVAANALSAATNAQDDIDNLEVGGRNLLILSQMTGYLGGGLGKTNFYTINESTITATNQTLNGYLPGFKVNCNGSTEFIISGKTTTLSTVQTYHKCFDSSGTEVRAQVNKNVNVTDGKFEIPITVPSDTSYIHVGIGTAAASNYSIYDVKMEKGNKATDWTPAPEDVDASISAAQSTANDAKNQANTNASNIASVTTKVTSQGTDLSVLKDQISSKIWQQDITNTVNNLEIGGRNLLPISRVHTDDTIIQATSTKYLKLFNNQQYNGLYFPFELMETSTDYILHFDITCLDGVGNLGGHSESIATSKVYKDGVLHSYPWNTGGISLSQGVKTHIEVYFTTVASISGLGNPKIYIQPQRTASPIINLNYVIENLKLEKGNKPTDWTPAPEDTATTAEVNTLSTRYAEVKQTVDGLTSTVASHTTEINKKADGSTVATVNDKVSKLEQNLDGFKTTVSNTYSTKDNLSDAINGLEIGARNLLILSQMTGYRGGVLESCNYYKITNSTITATNQPTGSWLPGFKVICNGSTEFIISGKTTTLSTVQTYHKCFNNNGVEIRAQQNINNTVSNNRFEIPITVPSDTSYIQIGIGTTATSNYSIYDVKMEKGNKPTDWTPAPEDVDADISALEGRVTKTETSITQTADSITSLASRTSDVETNLSTNYTKKTLPDTRNDNQNPGWYISNYPKQIITEFKGASVIGLSGETYCTLTTYVPWTDPSGGYPKQVANIVGKQYWRTGISNTEWSAWKDAYGTALDAQTRVSTAETKIIQNADSITSVANRTAVVEDKFGQYSTTAQMNSAIAQRADSITSTVAATYTTKQQLENVQIGSTNYLLDSAGGYILTGSDQPTVSSRDSTVPKFTTLTTAGGNAYVWIQNNFAVATTDIANSIGLAYSFSVDIKVTGSFTGAKVGMDIRNASHVKALGIDASIPNDIIKDTWIRVGGTGTTTNSGDGYTRALLCFTWSSSTVGSSIEYRNVQLEFGNKWSDWKQSTFEAIQAVATAQGTADDAVVAVTAAQSSIEQLKDQISMLVINGDKGSMMTQTADGGWQFNMGTVNTTIDGLSDDVKNVKEQSDKTDANVSDLDKRITGLEEVTEYVHIGTYTEPDTGAVVPSIDLGEGDSDFKLKITNKEILFTNGSAEPPVHIDSEDQVLEIRKAEIRTDLRIGNVVFAKRPNGNVGISWKEV